VERARKNDAKYKSCVCVAALKLDRPSFSDYNDHVKIVLLEEGSKMPIYTYRCENCGFQFDEFQRFSDSPLTKCPECGKKTLHKVYTPVGIVFKGSGFYATDHRSPSGATHTSSSHTEEKPAETKTETPAATKPAAEKTGD
jgi:putative FmdB family regulatory protein